jgi:hypothetical protein
MLSLSHPHYPPSISRNEHPTAPLVSTYVPLPLHYCKMRRWHEKKAVNMHRIHSTASHPVDCGAYNTYRHPHVVQWHVNDANRSHKYTEMHRESLTTQETLPDHMESSSPIAIPSSKITHTIPNIKANIAGVREMPCIGSGARIEPGFFMLFDFSHLGNVRPSLHKWFI